MSSRLHIVHFGLSFCSIPYLSPPLMYVLYSISTSLRSLVRLFARSLPWPSLCWSVGRSLGSLLLVSPFPLLLLLQPPQMPPPRQRPTLRTLTNFWIGLTGSKEANSTTMLYARLLWCKIQMSMELAENQYLGTPAQYS